MGERLEFTPDILDYIQQHSLAEPDCLKQLREETQLTMFAKMQLLPEQAQFLRWLIQLTGARQVIDIGTFTGYSALSAALAIPEDGKVITCDTRAEWTAVAERFWAKSDVGHKIDLRLAPAANTLQALIDSDHGAKFDFIFIDADKQNYQHYYDLSLMLLRPGGLMVVDNVLWQGKVADPNENELSTRMLRTLNKFIYSDTRVSMCMLPYGDGLTLVQKK